MCFNQTNLFNFINQTLLEVIINVFYRVRIIFCNEFSCLYLNVSKNRGKFSLTVYFCIKMQRKSFQEDPNKMQKLRSSRNTTRSPAGSRLPSYPIHDYPLQTPPTRELRTSPRIISPDRPDSPEMLLLDHVHDKIQLAAALQKWRQLTFLRRQKKRIFQMSLSTANFDIEPRIETIYEGHEKQIMRRSLSTIKNQLTISREVSTAEVILHRRKLCKFFNLWQSKLMAKVQRHTIKNIRKAEVSHVTSIPDLMAHLHTLLSKQAELETELEKKDREISDVTAVIRENRSQYSRIEDEIKDATMENQRIMNLKQGIDHDYKDQIATLRMSLSNEINLIHEKIEEGRQRMAQQEKAKKITNNTLYESQEALQSKMSVIKQKLGSAQSIAIHMRDDLLRNDEEQTEISRELIAIQAEINQLRNECNSISNQSQITQNANNQSLDKLKDVYAQRIEQLNMAKMRIHQNNEELNDQDARIESLTRELALCRQRSKTAMDAFREDDENAY
ncbi:hypothetical protein TRFO_23310 [Tritrichomonas foetus]|uniref:Uncharacterized protein n=1 Tax=Tritrichomonas foetus TaxID=1144522 RepID=A0A1J4K9U0_9EUKA|nr:hypothetical protein TRFO_23310 [Tritrichomonas foetus]|eukprot:OHT08233.1 hypothetical protein TRFO_23310 [Tritrichomonas foetus]